MGNSSLNPNETFVSFVDSVRDLPSSFAVVQDDRTVDYDVVSGELDRLEEKLQRLKADILKSGQAEMVEVGGA